jgi:periplasmic divalent cation tolerance protein
MEAYFVYITASNKEEARNVGKALLADQLVACINIVDNMESMFVWENAYQHEHEVVMIAKTKENLVDELVEKVKSTHSYDCPCVVAFPLKQGNGAFLDWIKEETK